MFDVVDCSHEVQFQYIHPTSGEWVIQTSQSITEGETNSYAYYANLSSLFRSLDVDTIQGKAVVLNEQAEVIGETDVIYVDTAEGAYTSSSGGTRDTSTGNKSGKVIITS